MPSTNAILAGLFQQMADLVEVTGGNKFKAIAYQKVARTLDDLTKDVAHIDTALLPKVEGIGSGSAERIAEFIATGQIDEHQKLLAQVPPGLLKVLEVPGLGPKGVAQLWKEGGVDSLESLAAKIDSGELTKLKGFGPKKLDNIKKNLAFAAGSGDRIRIGKAMTLAESFKLILRDLPGVDQLEHAGSLRRGKETIGDVDLLVTVRDDGAASQTEKIFDAFVSHPFVTQVLVRGDTKASVRVGAPGSDKTSGGTQVDLRIVPRASFGAALMYFTGSKEHNVALRERAIKRGMSLNEYALTREGAQEPRGRGAKGKKGEGGEVVASATEEEVYAALGLAWVPPELREDRGEVARAEKSFHHKAADVVGGLPALLELSDIKAELHSHTVASDGKWEADELAEACITRGYHTVAITDHSKSQHQANGLENERLIDHIELVHRVAKKLKGRITVLAGSEVDILSDGRLDYPDELLAQLDWVVASPHAALSQEPDKATARLVKACANPYVHVLGHPSGRIINRRQGLSPDWDAVFRAAAAHDVALEINANPYRLDLRDTHARAALEDHGCKLSINTDCHGEPDMLHLRYGVMTARRAGATKQQVINAWDHDTLHAWRVGKRRGKGVKG